MPAKIDDVAQPSICKAWAFGVRSSSRRGYAHSSTAAGEIAGGAQTRAGSDIPRREVVTGVRRLDEAGDAAAIARFGVAVVAALSLVKDAIAAGQIGS